MATCLVTLNGGFGDDTPVTSGHMLIQRRVRGNNGVMIVAAGGRKVPMTLPHATVTLEQGVDYLFSEQWPGGISWAWKIPTAATVNYSALVPAEPLPIPPPYQSADDVMSAVAGNAASTFTGVLNGKYGIAQPGLSVLKRSIADGDTNAVQILSDSTGNETWEWPYLFAAHIATANPARTVQWLPWSDTTQAYALRTVIQTGTAGARYMNMVNTNYPRKLDNSAAAHLTGAIDVRVNVNMADWTPGNSFGAEVLIGEAGGTGDWGWSFSVNSGGILKMFYSVDGTTLASIQANAVHGITDGSTYWIRCVFTPDDGAGNRTLKSYKSTDGIAWTAIGTTVTTLGAVTLSDRIAAGSAYLLGNQGAATNTTAVQIFEVDVRDGEDGVPILPRMPDNWGQFGAGTTHPMVGAPVTTIVCGAHPGATISYLDEATRKKRLTPDYGQILTILSCSHNETRKTGRSWFAAYKAWVDSVRTRTGSPILAVTQNPQRVAAVYYREQARRRTELIGFAKGLGIDSLDTFAAFTANPTWSTDYMSDDVHPNASGQAAWRDALTAAYNAA